MQNHSLIAMLSEFCISELAQLFSQRVFPAQVPVRAAEQAVSAVEEAGVIRSRKNTVAENIDTPGTSSSLGKSPGVLSTLCVSVTLAYIHNFFFFFFLP